MNRHIRLSLVLAGALATGPVSAQRQRYELAPETTYTVGCYDPCDCPISAPAPVRGTFELRLLEFGHLSESYEVSNLFWTVSRASDAPLQVFGCGRYEVRGEFAVEQRLELDLLIDGEVHHFESGWQPGGGALPMAIDLTVSMNNMVCFDRVFEIHATSPAPAGGFELDCSLDAGKASLRWTNERPEPVARYEILRDGTVVAELDPAARAYEEQAQEGRHLYIVVAVLAAVIVGGGPGGDLFVGSCCVGVEPPAAAVNFIRGDCNGDGEFRGQVTDAVFLLNFNFSSGPEPGCMQACDANGDGGVRGEVSDAVYMLNFNFLGGPPPAAPFPGCGPGELPGDEALGCATPSAGCA